MCDSLCGSVLEAIDKLDKPIFFLNTYLAGCISFVKHISWLYRRYQGLVKNCTVIIHPDITRHMKPILWRTGKELSNSTHAVLH